MTAGSYTMQIQIYNDNKTVIAEKNCTLRVVNPSAPSSSKNVLCIGDSNIEPGEMVSELYRMLNSDGGTPNGLNYGNINFVGSHRGYMTDIEYPNVFLEAHGGWSWDTYIKGAMKTLIFTISSTEGIINRGDKVILYNDGTQYAIYTVQEINLTDGVGNIRCLGTYGGAVEIEPYAQSGVLYHRNAHYNFSAWEEENYAPFIDNGVVSFTKYANDYCGGKIDVLDCNLGTNQILSWDDSDNIAINDAKTLINAFHRDFPNSKVIINLAFLPSLCYPTSSPATEYNNSLYELVCRNMSYNKKLIELSQDSQYSSYVSISPVSAFFDVENCVQKGKKAVNLRLPDVTEIIGTNQLHPQVAGKLQISDAVLPILLYMLNN